MASKSDAAAALAAIATSNSNANIYGQLSPLVQQMENWSVGQGPPLPRTQHTFTSGAFGPMLPIMPMAIDEPLTPEGRPRPRRWQLPVGFNLPVGIPGTEGLKLVNFQVLQSATEMSSIARSCIDICKHDILALKWDISPTAQAALAMEGDPKARAEFEQRKEIALNFWRRPDPRRFRSYSQWLNALLEDMLVLDAMAIYLHPTPKKGGGPFRSDYGAFEALDGSLIKPLVNTFGEPPAPPEPAYQSYQWGIPRADLMDALFQFKGDLDENDFIDEQLLEQVNSYQESELIYLRRNDRNHTVYGFGESEQAIVPISISIMRQQWQWSWFSAGSLPAVFMDPGESIATAEEARQLQDAINMLGGDQSMRHQVIVLPPGAKTQPQKDVQATDEFDEWITASIAMVYGLALPDLGITPKSAMPMSSSGAASNNAQQQAKAAQRGILPRIRFLKEALFDPILQDLWGQKDMEWDWGLTETGENQTEKITLWLSLTKSSVATIDETRVVAGLDPLGLPETSVPLAFTATGVTPLATAVQLAQAQTQIAQQTASAPAAATPPALPPAPPAGPEATPPPKPTKPGGGKPSGTKPPAKPGSSGTDDQISESPAQHAAEQLDSTNTTDNPMPGGTNAKKPSVSSSPASGKANTKAFANEVEIPERYLKRGNEIANFVPEHISHKALAVGKAFGSTPQDTIALVKRAQHHQDKRDAKLQALRTHVGTGLGRLVARVRQGVIGAPVFVDQGTQIITQAMQKATQMGADDAIAEYGDDGDTPPDMSDVAHKRSLNVAGYLAGVLAVIVGASKPLTASDGSAPADGDNSDDLDWRMNLYGEALTGGYEEGYGTGASSVMGEPLGTWVSEDDSATCELCEARNGQQFTLDTLPGWPGDGGYGDEASICYGGPACYPGNTIVEGRAVGALQTWYAGEMIELRTAAGRHLTVTPNHPIATARGFVRAGELRHGDELFAKRLTVKTSITTENGYQVPAAIENVFDTFEKSDLTWDARFVATRHDLHGDGEFVKGDIHVVGTDSILLSNEHTRCDHPAREGIFIHPTKGITTRAHLCSCRSTFVTPRDAAISVMSSSSESIDRHPLIEESNQLVIDDRSIAASSSITPSATQYLGSASQITTVLLQQAGQSMVTDLQFLGELCKSNPGFITTDRIVSIDRFGFRGYVYDLQTETGWQVANDILVSNCRCSIEWHDANKDASSDPTAITTNIGRANQIATNTGVIADARAADARAAASRQAAIDQLASGTRAQRYAAERMANRDSVMGVPGTVQRQKWDQANTSVDPETGQTVGTIVTGEPGQEPYQAVIVPGSNGDYSWAPTNADVAPAGFGVGKRANMRLPRTPKGKSAMAEEGPACEVGAIIMMAMNSGRVLLQQRASGDYEDLWELPGGHLNEGETPFEGACREWSEEVGSAFPDGELISSVSQGAWTGFLFAIEHEDLVSPCSIEQEGDIPKAVGWYSPDPTQLPSMRPEFNGFPWEKLAEFYSTRQMPPINVPVQKRTTRRIRDTDKLRAKIGSAADKVKRGGKLTQYERELAIHYQAGWRPGVAIDPSTNKSVKAGNAQALIDWYNAGADGAISWGDEGDWQACVDVASNYMSDDQAAGFCQLRHMDATDMTTSEHASEDK